MSMTTKNCRKCNGTGYLPHFARTDAGKCWACTDRAVAPTAEMLADDALWLAQRAALTAARAERSAARRAAREATAS